MATNQPQISAKTLEEFQKLQSSFEKLPNQVKDRIESISMGISKPEYILKQEYSEYTKVVCPDGITSIASPVGSVKIRTEHGTFMSKVSEKGYEIDVFPFLK